MKPNEAAAPTSPMSLHTRTIVELRALLAAGEIHPREIIADLAAAITARNPALGGYLSHDPEAALAAAGTADLGAPLGGIPVALKDNLNALGQPCTCGSAFLAGAYTAPYDATATARLRAAGAIPFGRTNLDEFAMGSSTENSALQTTRNPWAPDHVPGGSSGGSAAVVAADLAIAALGSDTGGSIRQPASFCGVVGMKPTYGRVSRYGLVAFASSLDQIGPLAKCVDDAALLLNAIAGRDPRDATTEARPVPDFRPGEVASLAGLRVGLPEEYLGGGLDPQVRDAVLAAAKVLEELGAELVPLRLPATEHAVAAYYIIAPAEASANLARFDGVRYGRRSAAARDTHSLHTLSREEGFGPEVKRRILLGTFVLSAGFYDSYYLKAQQVRQRIREDFAAAFARVDILLGPAAPTPAFPLGAHRDDPLALYLADVFTIPANLAGLPAVSVPCGFANGGGGRRLPVGLQLIGPPFAEAALLRAAKAYESATTWHRERPPPPPT
jgi:aspartyl-tRNA(Asn)/glutamyl-tRNA(Gln) amidotransferase subunit A